MGSKSKINRKIILVCMTAVSFGVGCLDAKSTDNGMDMFYTIIYKAYCDKCVEGFKSETEEGYRMWKEGEYRIWKNKLGLDDKTILTSGDFGNTLESIKTKKCSVLSAEKPDPRLECNRLVDKFRIIKNGPDARYVSSEATWEHFISSLREGNREKALGCFVATNQAEYKAHFESITDSDMKDMASQMQVVGFSKKIENYQEVMIKNGDKAGIVLFVNIQGEWKISHL